MFIGREQELSVLNKLYESKKFEYLVMYGRRRVGKTEILKEFIKKHKAIFYSAIEKKSNLEEFSSTVFSYFGSDIDVEFKSYEDVFKYIASKTTKEKTVLIIDEFPYMAKNEPSIKSILQHAIDHLFLDKNILLILCGSSVSFMSNDVIGNKSPLYGRNTSVLEVLPFEYYEVSKFLPHYSKEDQIRTYNILGGIPYYLSKFDDSLSVEENIAEVIISPSATLKEEPISLLKSELREPATYNAILEAIAKGANKITEISEKTKINVTFIPKYLRVLQEMRLVEKIVCAGEKLDSRKSQYIIKDNFFAFWYAFVFSNATKIELMKPLNYVHSLKDEIANYMGVRFEKVCLEYLKREAINDRLPFIPSSLGKWWGGNKITKKQDDIDILGIDKEQYLFCECKFKNEDFDLKEFNDLITISRCFDNAKDKYYYLFIKSNFTKAVIEESKKYNCKLITIEKM